MRYQNINQLLQQTNTKNKNIILIVPHHGGDAGDIRYIIHNYYFSQAAISVGPFQTHHHPNPRVINALQNCVQNIQTTFNTSTDITITL